MEDLENEMGITLKATRKKILKAATKLQRDHGEARPVLSFWQWRSMNRAECDYAVPFLANAPRYALWKGNALHPIKVVGGVKGSLLWVFAPHLLVATNADQFFFGLPWQLRYAHYIMATTALAAFLAALKKSPGLAVKNVVAAELGCAVWAWIFATFFYPFIPWFICDLFFYYSVYLGTLVCVYVCVCVCVCVCSVVVLCCCYAAYTSWYIDVCG